MNIEQYLKLAALAAVLVAALVYPIISALVITGVAAWHLQDIKICDIALVEKLIDLTPPGIRTILTGGLDQGPVA